MSSSFDKTLLLVAGLATFSSRPAEAQEPAAALPSPFGSQASGAPKAPLTAEELRELDDFQKTYDSFVERALDYRKSARALIEYRYQQKRDILFNSYEQMIVKLEGEQRERRESAIAKFEQFLERYPDDGRYTPDAMFRLSELYFERSYDDYFQRQQTFEKAMAAWQDNTQAPQPTEPSFHYEPTIAMMQRLIVEFPKYRLVDGAYYLLGYCLGEQGEFERAVDVFQELVQRRPDSRFAPEVWTRIGEFYFDNNELERALLAYKEVLGHADSPFYDKALYKLAWTHYRLADPEHAPEEYQLAVDTFVELLEFNERSKAEGKERGGDLRRESIQYIAISYAEEKWGGLDKLVAYADSRGERPYTRDMFIGLGDIYFDQTRFDESVRAYALVQQRYGSDRGAPEIQEKIITALERARNFEASAAAREELTRLYSEGSPWFEKHKGDAEAVRGAQKLIESSLYAAALFHHKQAQVHRDANKIDLATQEYGKAADAYGRYLQRFPHDKQLYDLTFYHAEALYFSLSFEEAAKAYQRVRDTEGETKYREDSAFSVVLSYENAVKQAEAKGVLPPLMNKKSADRPVGVPIEAQPIPELRLELVAASDRYAEIAPGNEKLPNVLYKAAETFYSHDHLPEARTRFEKILDAYPKHEVAPFAANLIIETFLAEQDFGQVEAFTRGLLERPVVPGDKTFKAEIVKFKTGAMFKLAEDLGTAKDHEKAAALYLKLLDEHPDAEFADEALNNAARAYEEVSRFDSASKLYERLVDKYPKSPLADRALFRVGVNAERFFSFEKAISSYLKLTEKYPKSERRADAIYNAAYSLENLQEYERSAEEYQRYCKLFPKREDAPQVCFRAGVVYEKMGDNKRVIATYENFIRAYRGNSAHQDRIVEAHLRIAKAQARLKNDKAEKAGYESTLRAYKQKPEPKGAPYAAEAQFNLVEREFATFKKLQFGTTAKQQKQMLAKKAESLKAVETKYVEVTKLKQFDWTLASLFRIGQLYQEFSESLINAPCPDEIKKSARRAGFPVEEVCDEYRIQLEERATSIEDKAVQAYETTITKAREFQVANTWTKQTLVALNRLRRAEWPLQKDAREFVDDAPVAAPSPVDGAGKPALAAPPPEPAPTAEPAADPAAPVAPSPTPADPGAAPLAPSPVAPAPPAGAAPLAPTPAPSPAASPLAPAPASSPAAAPLTSPPPPAAAPLAPAPSASGGG